jgi:hypothetical protein
MNGAGLHEFILDHREPDDLLYAVVDGAQDWDFARSAWTHFGLEGFSLMGWDTPPHMQSVSPHLVPMKYVTDYPYAGSRFLDLWADRIGNNHGILILTRAGRHRLFEHLEGIFETVDERGKGLFFRYYDPRVLRAYLPTCTETETRDFFGPVRAFLVESEQPGRIELWEPGPEGVPVRTTPP